MKTIAQEWEYFERTSGLCLASDVQRSEMKKAFYAGVIVLLHGAVNASDDEEVGAAYLDQVRGECNEFAAEMIRQATERN